MYLRALEPEDLDALYALENEIEEWESGSSTVRYSRYALRDYIANNAYDIYADRQVRHVISDDSGRLLGLVDLVNFEPRNSRAEVSVVVCQSARRSGIATWALAEIVSYVRDFLHLNQLYAIVPVSNAASCALFAKVGFVHTATLHQWVFNKEIYEDAYVFQLFLKK